MLFKLIYKAYKFVKWYFWIVPHFQLKCKLMCLQKKSSLKRWANKFEKGSDLKQQQTKCNFSKIAWDGIRSSKWQGSKIFSILLQCDMVRTYLLTYLKWQGSNLIPNLLQGDKVQTFVFFQTYYFCFQITNLILPNLVILKWVRK